MFYVPWLLTEGNGTYNVDLEALLTTTANLWSPSLQPLRNVHRFRPFFLGKRQSIFTGNPSCVLHRCPLKELVVTPPRCWTQKHLHLSSDGGHHMASGQTQPVSMSFTWTPGVLIAIHHVSYATHVGWSWIEGQSQKGFSPFPWDPGELDKMSRICCVCFSWGFY
jgi:hypothetical protein